MDSSRVSEEFGRHQLCSRVIIVVHSTLSRPGDGPGSRLAAMIRSNGPGLRAGIRCCSGEKQSDMLRVDNALFRLAGWQELSRLKMAGVCAKGKGL